MIFREAARRYVSEPCIIQCEIAQIEGLDFVSRLSGPQRLARKGTSETFVTRTNYTCVINSASYL
jgi:hypothetical protein